MFQEAREEFDDDFRTIRCVNRGFVLAEIIRFMAWQVPSPILHGVCKRTKLKICGTWIFTFVPLHMHYLASLYVTILILASKCIVADSSEDKRG